MEPACFWLAYWYGAGKHISRGSLKERWFIMCPYYDPNYNKCNFFDSLQSDSQRDHNCLSDSNWKNCVNYTNRSFEEKANKRLR